MTARLNVLMIEDTLADFLLVSRHLKREGLDVYCCQVGHPAELAEQIDAMPWDIVLSDYNVPGMEFTESLALLRARLPDVPVILVSGTVGEEKAVELLKLGVTDFLLKDHLVRLVPAIRRAQRDIEELRARHLAEHTLRVKSQLLLEMSAIAHIGAWEYCAATGHCAWTEEVARIHEAAPSAGISTAIFFSFFHGDSREEIETALDRAVACATPFDLELEIVTGSGQRKWVRMVFAPIGERAGGAKICGSTQDITQRKLGEIMLLEQKDRAQVTLHSIGDAVITSDARGMIDYLNPAAEVLTGWCLREALNKPLMDVLNIVDMDERLALENPTTLALLAGTSSRQVGACLLIAQNGTSSAIEHSTAPIRNRAGGIIGAVLVLRDVTASLESIAKIAYQAMHDGLTDLPNRTLAWDRMEQAIAAAKRDGTSVGVLFLDLDRFKNINDSLGHATGDSILKQVATRLVSVTRATDTVSRQGGDEFMVIMPGAHQNAHYADLAQKILTAVSAPYFVKQQELNMTFSIGISVYPHDGSDASTLISNADAAMYNAKEAGRDNYQFYSSEMNDKAAKRLTMEVQLRHAVVRQEFVIYYQPKVDVLNRRLVGAEALIRWKHPQLGLLSPSHFIGIAEECGLIATIGQWVAQEVCRQNLAWLARNLACVPISVNLSALQFRNKSLVNSLRILLEETGLPPRLLELELTESIIMQCSETVIETLQQLKLLGVRLSIDDFGTGYSSLSYLKRFPIDTIKIDQSFVKDIARDERDEAIIKAIISMAHSLKMSVIAEGVETEEQFAFLEAHHCDEIQGYYFSEPVPAIVFEEMLAGKNMNFR